MRNLAEKRHNDWKKAIRKRNISRNVYRLNQDWYNNLHQFSKNKVHCSCHICRGWTKHGENTISDKRKLEKMEDQILDNEENF